MREGRRRPSLDFQPAAMLAHQSAAMREGRRRPSLGDPQGAVPDCPLRRNEGGAPAPLVAPPHT